MHRDHTDRTTTLNEGSSTLDKHRAQVCGTALVVFVREPLERVFCLSHAQIRRVSDQGRIAAVLQDLAHVGGSLPVVAVRAAQQLLPLPCFGAARDLAEQRRRSHGHADERPVGVSITQLLD